LHITQNGTDERPCKGGLARPQIAVKRDGVSNADFESD
jgi:hypothetical protein